MSALLILLSGCLDRLRGGGKVFNVDIDKYVQPRLSMSLISAWLAVGELNLVFALWTIGFWLGMGFSVGNSWIVACVRRTPNPLKSDGWWQRGPFMRNAWVAVTGRGLLHSLCLIPAVVLNPALWLHASVISPAWPLAAWLYGVIPWAYHGRGEFVRGCLLALFVFVV